MAVIVWRNKSRSFATPGPIHNMLLLSQLTSHPLFIQAQFLPSDLSILPVLSFAFCASARANSSSSSIFAAMQKYSLGVMKAYTGLLISIPDVVPAIISPKHAGSVWPPAWSFIFAGLMRITALLCAGMKSSYPLGQSHHVSKVAMAATTIVVAMIYFFDLAFCITFYRVRPLCVLPNT